MDGICGSKEGVSIQLAGPRGVQGPCVYSLGIYFPMLLRSFARNKFCVGCARRGAPIVIEWGPSPDSLRHSAPGFLVVLKSCSAMNSR